MAGVSEWPDEWNQPVTEPPDKGSGGIFSGIGSWLGNLLGGGGTNDDKLLALMGTGILSLIDNSNKAAQPLKQPEYVPAPFYDRALTAPMRDVNSLGAKLYFNPNPFQLDPTEAAKRYGPSQQEINASTTAYNRGLASLYANKPTKPIGTMYTPGKQLAAQLGRAPTLMEMLSNRQGYSRGGSVAGPGDGMSDSIPTSINGQQPAALSDGEYVLPAHFVSAIGNGSTRAGVQQIENMVNRVMQHKYGSADRTPNPVNPRAVLP